MSRPGPGCCATTPHPDCWLQRSPLPTISAVLGHASAESTNLYMSVDRAASARLRPAGPRKRAVMSSHGFTSAFATDLEAYLAFKANMGFYGASRIWYLKRFDAYCREHDRTRIR